jgi:putative endonuclease
MPYRISQLIRAPYVYLGAIFDRWYEEMPWRQQVPAGRRGEQLAARYLRRCGYIVLAQNYRAAGAELDLVALDGSILVFVEVKLRTGAGFGMPEEAIDHKKRDQIRRAANAFAERCGVPDLPARFDVVAITGAGRSCRLQQIKDAF